MEESSSNQNLHFTTRGEGPPVILVHGFAASNYDWAYLEPELVDHGFRVYSPDLIGHGSSSHLSSKTTYSFDTIYTHFSSWLLSLEINQQFSLVGHSLGGLISLNYAVQHPDSIRNLVLINPYYHRSQLNRFLRYISKNPAPYRKALQAAPAWLIHTVVSLDIRGYIHYEDRARKQKAEDVSRAAPDIVYIPGSIPHFVEQLGDIKSSTCVIWGTKDTTLNPKSFPELANLLPNATDVPINGSGHQPHLSRPDQLNRIVLEFLANHPSIDN